MIAYLTIGVSDLTGKLTAKERYNKGWWIIYVFGFCFSANLLYIIF